MTTDTPVQLTHSVAAWGSPTFADVLKQEILQLDPRLLPLQQGMSYGNYVNDENLAVLILAVSEEGPNIYARTGIMFSGIIGGCHCADDPSPDNEHPEYCELMFEINKSNALTNIHLLNDE